MYGEIDMNILLIVLIPLLGSVLPPLAIRWGRNACAWTAVAVTVAALGLAMTPLMQAFGAVPASMHLPWLKSAGFDLTMRMDGLAALFVLLILGIGLLVVIYARYYLSAKDPMGRLYGQLLVFMSAMLGVALSDNLILMLVFWEMTSCPPFCSSATGSTAPTQDRGRAWPSSSPASADWPCWPDFCFWAK